MAKNWCICRWSSDYTRRILVKRGEPRFELTNDPAEKRLVSLCGPLSQLDDWVSPSTVSGSLKNMRAFERLGFYGFPDGGVGDVALFASREEAQQVINDGLCGDQDWTSLDKPALISAMSWRVEVYDHHDGSTRVAFTGRGQRRALGEWAIEKHRCGKGRHRVKLIEVPDWPKMRKFMPTKEEAAHLWDVSAHIDRDRAVPDREFLGGLRERLGVPVTHIRKVG